MILHDNVSVMVIDNDVSSLYMVRDMIGDVYRMITASSMLEAVGIVKNIRPDVILIEHKLLRNGNESYLDTIRGSKRDKIIPVIFLSEVNEELKIKDALRMRPDWYILKPPTRMKLIEEIEKVVSISRSE